MAMMVLPRIAACDRIHDFTSFGCASAGAYQVITIVMSTVIGSTPERVWRAITDPSERSRWDERAVAPIDEDVNYPALGRVVRWRYRLGSIQTVMREEPNSVVPFERLRSEVSMGTMRFEQTYSLSLEQGETPRTRLGMKIVAENSIPVVGEVVDRFEVRRMAVDRVDRTLRLLQEWCESSP